MQGRLSMERMASESDQLVNGKSSETVDYDAVFGKASDEHAEDRPAKFAQTTAIGEFRNPKRFHWLEWIFLVVATLSMLSVIGVTIERFVYFEHQFTNLSIENDSNETLTLYIAAPCNSWLCEADVTFAAVLLVNLGFCAFYCYDGLFREQPFEILGYAVAVFIIIVYIIVNYGVKMNELEDPLRLGRLVLVLIFGPLNIFFALASWWKMGYLIFNVIGSNKILVRAYRFRSIFQTLQYFNFQVLCNIAVLSYGREGQLIHLAEKIILPILVVFHFLVVCIGNIVVLWEFHPVTIVWYVLNFPFGVYYVYKLIDVSVHWSLYSTEYILFTNDEDIVESNFKYVGAALLVACVVGVVIAVLTYVFMALTQINYGKGLKEKIPPPLEKYCIKR